MRSGVSQLVVAVVLTLAASMPMHGQEAGRAGSPAEGQAAAGQAQSHDNTYIIGDDDMLEIYVWKEPDLSRTVPVRSDGKISLPLAGEVQAAGRTPMQLQTDITNRLRSYVTEPAVTVIVQKINSEKFNVMGQVTKPGSYPMTVTTTVMDAIAAAGGFRDFAKKKDVYVLRQNPDGSESRYKFDYDAFIKGKNPQKNIRLRPGDTVVVP